MAAQSWRLLKACRREPVDRTPVWLMRQAGRYLPEYRELRKTHSLLEICRAPDLACEVAMQPLRRFDLDAAILFSDLLIPVQALGVEFDIIEGRGPVLAAPVGDRDAVRRLRTPKDLRELEFVAETIRKIDAALAGRLPVIGFAGAPFTLASYLVEGGPSRDFKRTKLFMYEDPVSWAELLERLADLVVGYLELQVRAGADVIQIFDSWVGCLGPREYRQAVFGPTRNLFKQAARLDVPVIHFGTLTGTLLDSIAEAGGDVLGVDWRIPLGSLRSRFPARAIQGNLDPLALLAPQEVLHAKIQEVLAEAGAQPGHIFNLGHGVLPDTPPDNVAYLVEQVHRETTAPRGS